MRCLDDCFFGLMGIDTKNFKMHIKEIKEEYQIEKFEEEKDCSISIDIFKTTFDKLIKKDIYNEKLLEKAYWIGNYQIDFDIARFLMLGSYLALWDRIYDKGRNLPFRIVKKNGDEYSSFWCKEYQKLFAHDTLKDYFYDKENLYEKYVKGIASSYDELSLSKRRIEKYSYIRTKKIFDKLNKKIIKIRENEKKLFKKENSYISKDYIENYIVLDITVGASLTLVCYHYLRLVTEKQFELVIPIIALLTELKCYSFRNEIAKIVFEILETQNYSEQIVNNTKNALQDIVIAINKAYTDVLYVKWYFLVNCDIKNECEDKVWREFIEDNGLEVEKIDMYAYEMEIKGDIEEERGMIPIIEKRNYETLPILFRIAEVCNNGMSYVEIEENYIKAWKKEEEIRRNRKIDKKSILYTKIHEIIVMQSIINR